MKYPQSFIDKVRRLYPDDKDMEFHAQNGSIVLGRFLDDSSSGHISLKEILNSTDLTTLKAKAQNLVDRRELYNQWFDLIKTK